MKIILYYMLMSLMLMVVPMTLLQARGGRGGAFAAGAILGGFTGAAIASQGPYYYGPYDPYWGPYGGYGWYGRPYYGYYW